MINLYLRNGAGGGRGGGLICAINCFNHKLSSDCDDAPITKIFSGKRCAVARMTKKVVLFYIWKQTQNSFTVLLSDVIYHQSSPGSVFYYSL